jgi:hypothetical protein
VFENRVLRRTFGPTREEVVRGLTELHNKIILKWTLWKECGRICTGFMWLRIATNGRLL